MSNKVKREEMLNTLTVVIGEILIIAIIVIFSITAFQ